jgi:hypothetical protein
VGQNDCVGHLAPEKRALELAAFKPANRTAQNAAPFAATADRSVKPAYDEKPQGEDVDRLQKASRFVIFCTETWCQSALNYCARGQAENLIKLHKSQLASDRTSCRSPIANQVRLVLHTGAYWLMLTVRDAIPTTRDLARAEFATLRLRLIKIAARVIETASRVRLAFAAACPEADLLRGLPGALAPQGP